MKGSSYASTGVVTNFVTRWPDKVTSAQPTDNGNGRGGRRAGRRGRPGAEGTFGPTVAGALTPASERRPVAWLRSKVHSNGL